MWRWTCVHFPIELLVPLLFAITRGQAPHDAVHVADINLPLFNCRAGRETTVRKILFPHLLPISQPHRVKPARAVADVNYAVRYDRRRIKAGVFTSRVLPNDV